MAAHAPSDAGAEQRPPPRKLVVRQTTTMSTHNAFRDNSLCSRLCIIAHFAYPIDACSGCSERFKPGATNKLRETTGKPTSEVVQRSGFGQLLSSWEIENQCAAHAITISMIRTSASRVFDQLCDYSMCDAGNSALTKAILSKTIRIALRCETTCLHRQVNLCSSRSRLSVIELERIANLYYTRTINAYIPNRNQQVGKYSTKYTNTCLRVCVCVATHKRRVNRKSAA